MPGFGVVRGGGLDPLNNLLTRILKKTKQSHTFFKKKYFGATICYNFLNNIWFCAVFTFEIVMYNLDNAVLSSR